jgi:hypothetical protein
MDEAVKKELIRVGAWRSLVAYLNGVQRAGGSNPLAPTMKIKGLAVRGGPFFVDFLVVVTICDNIILMGHKTVKQVNGVLFMFLA